MKSVTAKFITAAIVSLLTPAAFSQVGPNDNSSDTPNRIGNNPSTYSAADFVGATDPYDYFRFSLTEARSTSVALTGLSGEANIYMWGDNGTWEMGANTGSADELIRKQLQPGTYTILVYGWSGTVNYQLAVNSVGQASGRTEQLGIIDGMGGVNSDRTLQGNIGANERWVDYVFELPDRRDMTINVQTSAGVAASPRQTPQQWQAFDRDGNLKMAMNGGKHFVRLFGRPGQTIPFSLSIGAKPKDSRDQAGNSFATARNLGTVTNPPVAHSDYVGRWDFDDYYVINAPAGSEVNADLVHNRGSGAEIYLYDAAGGYVTHSANGDSRVTDRLSANSPQGGTYYLRVTTATKSGPSWEEARYTVRAGTIPLGTSSASGVSNPSSCPRGADGSNCVTSPKFFGSGSLNRNSTMTEQNAVGGVGDSIDYLSLRVYCTAGTAPSLNMTSTTPGFASQFAVGMTRIRGNNTVAPETFALGLSYSPPKSDYSRFATVFEYRFAISAVGPVLSSAGNSYNLTATHLGCS